MKLIVGLGNPGKQYEKTRHNIGFIALDVFAQDNDCGGFLKEEKFKSEMCKVGAGDNALILAKPQTFMNLSGDAVRNIAAYYKIASQDILVMHDELDLDVGDIKMSRGKGAAGHNGVASIIKHLGTEDFYRLRIGIGKKKDVLKKFGIFEKAKIQNAIQKTAEALQLWASGEGDEATKAANTHPAE